MNYTTVLNPFRKSRLNEAIAGALDRAINANQSELIDIVIHLKPSVPSGTPLGATMAITPSWQPLDDEMIGKVNRRARTVALRVPPTAPISPAAFAAVDLISKVALQLAQMPHRGVVKVHLPSASAIANAVIRKSFQHKQQASRDHGAPYLILSV